MIKKYFNSSFLFFNKSFDFLDTKLAGTKLPSWLKKSKYLFAAFIFFLILFAFTPPFTAADSGIPTYTVKRDNFLVSITESGEIRAKNSVAIASPRVRGNLKIVYLVPEGSYINAGDTVVKFDPTEALTSLKDAEAKLEIALSEKAKLAATQLSQMTRLESDFKSSELSFELSKLNMEQVKFEAEIKQQETKLKHQQNELNYKKANQELESQKIIQKSELNKIDIEVQQKKADLERAQRDLAMLTLTAPKEGLVVYETNWSTGRKINIGDTPWPGMTLISLPDLSSMESLTYINEVDISRVKKNLAVHVKMDAFQDSTFMGEIESVASLGKTKDNNSNIKVFEISVGIKSQSEKLKPGMTTSNKIIINEIPSVLFIPQEAVFEKEGKRIVYIRSGSGFDEKEIEVGEKSENHIIVSKGISTGDVVALRDPTIKIEPGDTPENKNETVSLPSVN